MEYISFLCVFVYDFGAILSYLNQCDKQVVKSNLKVVWLYLKRVM